MPYRTNVKQYGRTTHVGWKVGRQEKKWDGMGDGEGRGQGEKKRIDTGWEIR